MPAPRSARHARSLLLAAVLALLALPAATAQAWPGLNGYMAYGSNRTGSQFSDDIYVSPLDVESPIRLTIRRADDGQPAWSPDGTRLAFKTAQAGSNQLAVIDADGKQRGAADPHVPLQRRAARVVARRHEAALPAHAGEPARAERRHVGARRQDERRPDPPQPVTQPVLLRTGDERYPSYSPDGTQIAFRGDLDLVEPSGDEEIYVMNADGTNVRQLTSNADFDSAPSWSPDGKRILFERAPAGTFTPGTEAQEKDVYVMRADGTHVRRLTDSPGLDEGPEFSPDATKIAFSSARDGQQEIYVMDADGSNPRRLTDNPARDESPDWQALPFDGRGHRACGDDSLASGGASSVLAMRVPCHVARRIARRWSEAADAGTPRAQAPWPGVHHDAAALRPHGRGLRARARRRARATSRSCGATRRGRPRRRRPAPRRSPLRKRTHRPQDDPGDEGSAEAHAA